MVVAQTSCRIFKVLEMGEFSRGGVHSVQSVKFGADPERARSILENGFYGIATEAVGIGRLMLKMLKGRLRAHFLFQIQHIQATCTRTDPQAVFRA